MKNIPDVKLGLIAVSRDCFPIALSEKRRAAIAAAYQGELYECPITVENEDDMLKAVADVKAPRRHQSRLCGRPLRVPCHR